MAKDTKYAFERNINEKKLLQKKFLLRRHTLSISSSLGMWHTRFL
jgi:hypothetical protein